MRRVVIPELLDSDAGSPPEIRSALADLQLINAWFGGVATTSWLVERVARNTGASRLSLLDVAAGSGYLPAAVARRLRRRAVELQPTLVDRSRAHLNGSNIAVAADALALPFGDGSFDLVSCSLFAHHLEPQGVVRLVNEGLRVCRVAVLINDLVRHPLHLLLVYAGFPLYRSRFTRNDAPASVRRAYTEAEMRQMLAHTEASGVEISRHYLFRMGVIAWKKAG